MTYCVAWTDEDSAYLVADAVLTYPDRLAIDGRTSVGEIIAIDDACLRREAALKVVQVRESAIGYAGDVALAQNVVDTYAACVRRGGGVYDSLRTAICSALPAESDQLPQFLVIACDDAGPFMLSASLATGRITRTTGIQQIGSMDQWHRDAAQHVVRIRERVSQTQPISPARALALALSMFQCYGLLDNLIPIGIGGAFAGISISRTRVEWQADVLYVVMDFDESPINASLICARESAVVCVSGFMRQVSVIANSGAMENGSLSTAVVRDVLRVAREPCPDLVVLVNRRDRVVVQVDMQKSGTHDRLTLMPQRTADGGINGMQVRLSADLHHMLLTPYRPGSGDRPTAISFKSVGYRAPGDTRPLR